MFNKLAHPWRTLDISLDGRCRPRTNEKEKPAQRIGGNSSLVENPKMSQNPLLTMSGYCLRGLSSLQQRRWRKMQSLVADDEDNRRWRLKRACWRLTSSADLRAGRILVTLNDLLLQITWFVLANFCRTFFLTRNIWGGFSSVENGLPIETSRARSSKLVWLLLCVRLDGQHRQTEGPACYLDTSRYLSRFYEYFESI